MNETVIHLLNLDVQEGGTSVALCNIWGMCRAVELCQAPFECPLKAFDSACMSGLLVLYLVAFQTSVHSRVPGDHVRSQILVRSGWGPEVYILKSSDTNATLLRSKPLSALK